MIAFADRSAFLHAISNMPIASDAAARAARERQAELTKPAGSLGRLEEIAVFMAGWQDDPRPKLDRVCATVFAGNHGVAARGVSAFPAEVTAQMVDNFRSGGAAINVLSQAAGAKLTIVPLDLDRPTGDIASEAAMSEAECLDALNAGAAVVSSDTQLLVVGEMGIGSTTPAAALCAAAFGGDAAQWCGQGTGVDGAGLARKIDAVDQALALHRPHCSDPFEMLRRLGGREIAAMAGAMLAARLRRIPVLLDGFITCAAIAPIAAQHPQFTWHCLAAHCSAEAAHQLLLDCLGLEPLLRLDMRLGEGSGAALAVPLVRAALATHDRMATFAQAAVARAG
ncbi:nicotinate-nucleotide--dimethylbenzimidazole phosphoribosyltransferase [Novosphingobium chloroacetimidivorans]|uniref:Nicotinate-nucleotide--dimethylbenzimidazole phosphoribosyltransferase n=1 Tax=Novosphingobium chloroacetimidivorans TaxID=1428314 RepID=A0A7W7KB37_9SPHN|nr:nicotinate-nucleotide--dimethylbenzimidazole phosphoribosyltransferase [Novosphingobium chloroacetimidivorans]MBB4858913.1 nicotinate-nucleotide--dimethylbenzimidazole phosphoribosyltransferase [Novosphingobium chloroacetimidivorans]